MSKLFDLNIADGVNGKLTPKSFQWTGKPFDAQLLSTTFKTDPFISFSLLDNFFIRPASRTIAEIEQFTKLYSETRI